MNRMDLKLIKMVQVSVTQQAEGCFLHLKPAWVTQEFLWVSSATNRVSHYLKNKGGGGGLMEEAVTTLRDNFQRLL